MSVLKKWQVICVIFQTQNNLELHNSKKQKKQKKKRYRFGSIQIIVALETLETYLFYVGFAESM